ncbi:hypothetical protein ANCCAN_08052 [Ancylostoma caninum]|uniref:Uncharacterized protein n=1 Tax=Ancylostoma caninum TaxID=29170 RepID=A0A368GSH7_ANCCA|nr:hypothetical protein ANCCAN_08052 [Ancylostoma caninum]
MVCRRQLDEMCECDSVIPPMTITLMAIAKRSFPTLHRRQVGECCKSLVICAAPELGNAHVLHLIDHCNRAGAHKSWFEFYMHHMMKLRCPDVMNRAIETICACLLLESQETLITASVLMVDFMMDKKGQIQFEVPYVIPLVKLLTQFIHRLKYFKKLEVAVNKFVKESSQGSLSTYQVDKCHIVRMIAGTPQSEAKQLLLPYLKHLLFFQLAPLELGLISFELFATFCDPASEDHDLEKLKFLCLLRKSGGL